MVSHSLVVAPKHYEAADDGHGRRSRDGGGRGGEAGKCTTRGIQASENEWRRYPCNSVNGLVQSHHGAPLLPRHALKKHRRDGGRVQRDSDLTRGKVSQWDEN